MEISVASTILELTAIECSKNQDCYYNNWLVGIQQDPQKKLSQTEEKKIINNHILLKKLYTYFIQEQKNKNLTANPKKKNILGAIEYRRILQTLVVSGCPIDLLHAVVQHLQEISAPPEISLFYPGMLLQYSLQAKQQETAKSWAEYMQIKQQTIGFDEKHHSIYYALFNNYPEVLNILLDLKEVPNKVILCCHAMQCWNSQHSCIKEEEIIASVVNFMEKNSANPELQIEVLLKLYLNTEYLEKENRLENVINAIATNKNYMYLLEMIIQILSTYRENQSIVNDLITNSHSLENLIADSFAKKLVVDCKITEFKEKNLGLLKDKFELPEHLIKKIQLLFYKNKLNLDISDKEQFNIKINVMFAYAKIAYNNVLLSEIAEISKMSQMPQMSQMSQMSELLDKLGALLNKIENE